MLARVSFWASPKVWVSHHRVRTVYAHTFWTFSRKYTCFFFVANDWNIRFVPTKKMSALIKMCFFYREDYGKQVWDNKRTWPFIWFHVKLGGTHCNLHHRMRLAITLTLTLPHVFCAADPEQFTVVRRFYRAFWMGIKHSSLAMDALVRVPAVLRLSVWFFWFFKFCYCYVVNITVLEIPSGVKCPRRGLWYLLDGQYGKVMYGGGAQTKHLEREINAWVMWVPPLRLCVMKYIELSWTGLDWLSEQRWFPILAIILLYPVLLCFFKCAFRWGLETGAQRN